MGTTMQVRVIYIMHSYKGFHVDVLVFTKACWFFVVYVSGGVKYPTRGKCVTSRGLTVLVVSIL